MAKTLLGTITHGEYNGDVYAESQGYIIDIYLDGSKITADFYYSFMHNSSITLNYGDPRYPADSYTLELPKISVGSKKGMVCFPYQRLINKIYCNAVNDSSGYQYEASPYPLTWEIDNVAPTAALNLPDLYAGGTARITWSCSDKDGNTVYSLSLVRYLRRAGESAYTAETLFSGESTVRYIDDTIPADASGASVYYRLAFTDKIASTQYVNSSTAVVKTNSPPTVPENFTLSGDVTADTVSGYGKVILTWSASTDPDNNLEGYQLQRKVDNGSWETIYRGSVRTYTDNPSSTWETVAYRVCAYDTLAAYSGYAVSASYTVDSNNPPVITPVTAVSDGSMGIFKDMTAPDFIYTVTDADNDSVTVTEYLDGVERRCFSPGLGDECMFSMWNDSEYLCILNGEHVITIRAVDSNGAESTLTVTFTKDVDTIEVLLTDVIETADKPAMVAVNVQGYMPTGSIFTVWVCNNGFDKSPTWERYTPTSTGTYIFQNTEKTAEGWGVSVRVKLERGEAKETCYITSIGGNWR